MIEAGPNAPFILLLVGVLIVILLLAKEILTRVNIPPLVGWIAIGFICRVLGDKTGFLTTDTDRILSFLAEIGLVVLLFKIGLESKLSQLLKQLKKASFIWFFNVLVSGLAGFFAAYSVLGLDLVHSIVIGIALTATSVGISVKPWEETGAIRKANGQLLVDIAEMDDISSIVLMGFLFAMIPFLQGDAAGSFVPALVKTLFSFGIRMTVFSLLCILFSRFIEKPFARFIKKLEHGPNPMLTMISGGFIIAAIAAMYGFSLALGAFFAGLASSRDPEAVKMETPFMSIYEMFTPFFFLGIGLDIAPEILIPAFKFGGIIFVAAVLGKFIGTAIPAWISIGWKSAVILGVSMIPRAEIAMVIMDRSRTITGGVISEEIFSAMVIVSVATCVLAPIIVQILLNRQEFTQSSE